MENREDEWTPFVGGAFLNDNYSRYDATERRATDDLLLNPPPKEEDLPS